ncbi:MAG TPA: hypothetical protein PK177_15970, partial [Burkholderiaceae bacterium]|nr:hypothetical protein [Burkholderiaceae bacterium]
DSGCESPQHVEEASAERVVEHFRGLRARVVTFAGYSGAGYQNPATMLAHAARTLDALDPRQTIVNAGATAEGIGAVYRLAKQRGFRTAGIVSTQARQQSVALSPCVDLVFYVVDETWGGLLPGDSRLSPTSEAMVRVSDALIAIGGGEVARDELLAARQLGKPVEFVPADMDHALAREKAVAKGLPPPADFRGAAHAALLPGR